MTLISISTSLSVRAPRLLVFALLAAASTACTIDKDLATDTAVETDAPTTVEGSTDGATTDGATTDTTDTTDGTTDTTDTTGEPILGCPDHPTVDDCCCLLEPDEPMYGEDVEVVCDAAQEMLCNLAQLSCGEGDGDPSGPCQTSPDEAAVDCVLSALAGANPGTASVIFMTEADSYSRSIDFHIVGDGTAFRVERELHDLAGQVKDVGRYSLQPPAFFTECLTKTLEEKADCLREALLQRAEQVCFPGFGFSEI